MDEEHYNTQFEFTTTLFSKKFNMGKKPVQSFVFCGSTSFSYALIFSVKLRSFNIPKDPQAPYALQCNVNYIRLNTPNVLLSGTLTDVSNLNRRWNTNM